MEKMKMARIAAPTTAMPATMAVLKGGGAGGAARAYLRLKREVLIMYMPAVKLGTLVELSGIRGIGGWVTHGSWPARLVE